MALCFRGNCSSELSAQSMFWSVLSASFAPPVPLSQSRAHTLLSSHFTIWTSLFLVANVMKCSVQSCWYVIGGQVMLHTTKLQAYTGWAFSLCFPSTRQQWQRCNRNVTICFSQWIRWNRLPNHVWRKCTTGNLWPKSTPCEDPRETAGHFTLSDIVFLTQQCARMFYNLKEIGATLETFSVMLTRETTLLCNCHTFCQVFFFKKVQQ